jgi:nitroreductase
MDVKSAIENRRSIRHFLPAPLDRETIESILDAGRLAPSAKNRQPWRFVVIQGSARDEMSACLQARLARAIKAGTGTGSAANTFRVMREAPVTVLVFNPGDTAPWTEHTVPQMVDTIADSLSLGAAVQNMLLRAQELGVGTLWIGDTFYTHDELCAWVGRDCLLASAVALGYAAETPPARARMALNALVEWRGSPPDSPLPGSSQGK